MMEDSSMLRRSGRRRARPLEFWNFERLDDVTDINMSYNVTTLSRISVFNTFSTKFSSSVVPDGSVQDSHAWLGTNNSSRRNNKNTVKLSKNNDVNTTTVNKNKSKISMSSSNYGESMVNKKESETRQRSSANSEKSDREERSTDITATKKKKSSKSELDNNETNNSVIKNRERRSNNSVIKNRERRSNSSSKHEESNNSKDSENKSRKNSNTVKPQIKKGTGNSSNSKSSKENASIDTLEHPVEDKSNHFAVNMRSGNISLLAAVNERREEGAKDLYNASESCISCVSQGWEEEGEGTESRVFKVPGRSLKRTISIADNLKQNKRRKIAEMTGASVAASDSQSTPSQNTSTGQHSKGSGSQLAITPVSTVQAHPSNDRRRRRRGPQYQGLPKTLSFLHTLEPSTLAVIPEEEGSASLGSVTSTQANPPALSPEAPAVPVEPSTLPVDPATQPCSSFAKVKAATHRSEHPVPEAAVGEGQGRDKVKAREGQGEKDAVCEASTAVGRSTLIADTTGGGPVRRSSRVRTRPLEFWNFEQVEVVRMESGEVSVTFHKQEEADKVYPRSQPCPVHSQVSQQEKVSVVDQKTQQQLQQQQRSPRKRKLFSQTRNSLDIPAPEEEADVNTTSTKRSPVADSPKKKDDKFRVISFKDLMFCPLVTKEYKCYLASSLQDDSRDLYAGFIFIERGRLVWSTSKTTSVYVLEGCGQLITTDNNTHSISFSLKATQNTTVSKGMKLSIEKSSSCKMLKLFIVLGKSVLLSEEELGGKAEATH